MKNKSVKYTIGLFLIFFALNTFAGDVGLPKMLLNKKWLSNMDWYNRSKIDAITSAWPAYTKSQVGKNGFPNKTMISAQRIRIGIFDFTGNLRRYNSKHDYEIVFVINTVQPNNISVGKKVGEALNFCISNITFFGEFQH